MKKTYCFILGMLAIMLATSAHAQEKTVTITTNVGTMKAKLYRDVPRHVQAFTERARHGEFNGTLFSRVIKDFIIQGGSPDSKNASPGVRCGFGDSSAEIMPEKTPPYIHKRGALVAPRQNEDTNPQKKSDMSQFFLVQGELYTHGKLDTLERIANKEIRDKAIKKYYHPVRAELQMLKHDNKRNYAKRIQAINAKIDSVILATPGHLIFTDEQRKAYTTVGGCPSLDGKYTVFGELTEGFDVLETIANQPVDKFERPKKDIRILNVTVE